MVSDLGVHCLLISYKEDARLIWVNIKLHFISHVIYSMNISKMHNKITKQMNWTVKN